MTNSIIYPTLEVNGTLELPSSKPHIQRCLLIAFFNTCDTEITNMTWCTETLLLLDNLVILGLKIKGKNKNSIVLQGVSPEQITKNAEVNAEGSGFIFRAMVAIAALTNSINIKCNASLYSRDSVLDNDYLSYLGVSVTKSDCEFKFSTTRVAVTSNKISINKSSQFLSMAMILCVHLPHYEIEVESNNMGEGYIEITEKILCLFGYQCNKKGNIYYINKCHSDSVVQILIPTDFTSLGYMMSVLSVMKNDSSIQVNNYVAGNTRNDFFLKQLFKELGVEQRIDNGILSLENNKRNINKYSINSSLHELPSLATLIISCSVFTHRTVDINRISHVNNHKCQRIFVINENLRLLGLDSRFNFDKSGRFDGLHIKSNLELTGNTRLKSYNDHRVCAGNIVLSLGCNQPNIVEDVDTLADGFPAFLETLTQIGIHSKPILN
jgi:3-phosphoshikimate 1-carboxyvinyltransferase